MSGEGPVLILAASAGAGHLIAARALEEAFRKRAPELEVEVHDVLKSTTRLFRHLYARGYDALVEHLPSAMGWLYDFTDRPPTRGDGIRSAFQNLNARRTRRYIVESQPRLVVSTHHLPAEIVAHLRRGQRLACPQVTVVTDFEPHRLWAQRPTERYYTAIEEGKAQLLTWGVAPQSVLVTGIPVRAAFEQASEVASGLRARLRRALDLDPDRPIVLVMCGGCGIRLTRAWLENLATIRGEAQIVVVTGRNTHLHARVERVLRGLRRPVRLIAFTDAIPEWMRAADLLVSKPGGLTASEALVCGLPLVIVNPIPGQEVLNSDYLLEHGAAIKVNSPRLLGYRVDRLLGAPARLRELRENARAIARPGAADRIVADALALLSDGRDGRKSSETTQRALRHRPTACVRPG